MRMFDLLVDRAPIIGRWCRSTTVGGLGTLRYMINVDWMAVSVEVDGTHVICASILSLECSWAVGMEAW